MKKYLFYFLLAFSFSISLSATPVLADSFSINSPMGAKTLKSGSVYSDSIHPYDDFHYYKFTLTQKSIVIIEFDNDMDYYFLDSSAQFYVNGENSLCQTELKKGTYFLVIRSHYANYELIDRYKYDPYSFRFTTKPALEKIVFPYKEKTLTCNQTIALSPKFYPSNVENKNLFCYSTDGGGGIFYSKNYNEWDTYRQYDVGNKMRANTPGYYTICAKSQSNINIIGSFKLYIKPLKPKLKNIGSEKIGKHYEISFLIRNTYGTKYQVYIQKPRSKKFTKVTSYYDNAEHDQKHIAKYIKVKTKGTYKIKVRAIPDKSYSKKILKKCESWSKVYKTTVK